MWAFRFFIIIYFAALSTYFNSEWADESLNNLPHVTKSTQENGINFISESYMNVKAVQVNSDSFKFFSIFDDSFFVAIKLVFKKSVKYYYSVNSVAKSCAIRSYLHLLQKF